MPFYGGGRADLLCYCFLGGLPERDCPVHGEEVDGG